MAKPADLPAFLTCTDRLPIEVAIELIENEVDRADDMVEREALVERARQSSADKILWWIDHTLSLLVSHGHLARDRDERGIRGYRPTKSWDAREDVLKDLRPPQLRDRSTRDRARKLASQQRREAKAVAKAEAKRLRSLSRGRTPEWSPT